MEIRFRKSDGITIRFVKFNPYHDAKGRFSTSNSAFSFTYKPNGSKAHIMAIAREQVRRAEEEAKEIKNPLGDPDTIAGVKRGQPMTRKQANSGHVNPNFKNGGEYRQNCQSCVVAYEARLRGYNVSANPKTSKQAIQLSHNTRLAWIDPKTGKSPDFIRDDSVTTAKECMVFMDKTVQQGQRYTLQVIWKDRGGGHIVSLDKNSKGVLRLYDPQNGRTLRGEQISKYFLSDVEFSQQSIFSNKATSLVNLIRVDNMRINPIYADKIMGASK